MSTIRQATAALLLTAASSVAPARAWGPEGHAIIADIAEAHLTPAASAQVAQLLAVEGHHRLDQVSSWADDYRATHRETAPWHFVDIPLDADHYDPERDCKNDDASLPKP